MLDARPEAARRPALARRRERVEHGAVGGVADRVHREVEARVGAAAAPRRAARSALSSGSPSPASANGSSIEAVREPSVPSANALTGPMRSQSSPRPLRSPSAMISSEPLGGERRPDAQREAARRRCSRCHAREAVLALEVVDPGQSARVRLAHAVRDRARRARARPERGSPPPRPRPRSRGARRWARRAASRSTTGAVPIGSRSSAAEESQAVWWSCAQSSTGRSPQAASSASRCGSGSPAGQRSARQPAPITQPSARGAAAAAAASTSACERVAREVEPAERQRPLEEVHVRVGEAGHDAAAAEVDALVRDERAIALAHVDAASDAVARDRDRARERKPGIARAHAAVVEDHAAEGSPRRCSPSLSSAPCCRPRLPPRRSRAVSRRSRPACVRDGLDAALLVQAADLVYLSGTAQNAHLVVPASGEPLLLVRRDLERARAESALEPHRAVHVAARAPRGAGLGRPARAAAPRPRARRAAGRLLPALPRAPARSRDRRLHAGAVVGALAQERVGAGAHPRRLRADAGRAWSSRRSCSCPAARVRRAQRARPSHAGERPRGHDPLPRHQQRVPLRAGAGRRERCRPRPDRDAAARARASRPRRAAAPRAGRCARAIRSSSTSRGWPRATSRIRRGRSSSGTPIPCCSTAYETCRRILRRVRRRCCGRDARQRALRARRSRSRAEAGHAERFMGAGRRSRAASSGTASASS